MNTDPQQQFRKGNRMSRGGARPGSGPKPLWFKIACAKALQESNADQFLKAVIRGDKLEPHLTKEGDVIYTEARVGDRVYSVEVLRDSGLGKPTQELDLTSGGGPLTVNVISYASKPTP